MNLGWKYERYKKIYGASTYKSEKTIRRIYHIWGEHDNYESERFANAVLGKHILIL